MYWLLILLIILLIAIIVLAFISFTIKSTKFFVYTAAAIISGAVIILAFLRLIGINPLGI